MEPIILITSAILSQFQVSTLVGSIIGGIIGNRSDAFLMYSTDKLYKKLRNNIGEPGNHDIQKAVRQSYLKATLIAITNKKASFKWHERFTGNDVSLLNRIETYIQKELRLLSKDGIHFPVTDIDKEYQSLLFPAESQTSDHLAGMILKLKESIFYELEYNGYVIETDFKDAILKGWSDKNKHVDWYELTCAFFIEELKINSRLSTIIQTQYLENIGENIADVNISMEKIQLHLEKYYVRYKELVQRIDEILNTVTRTERKVDELPEEMRKIVKEELEKRGAAVYEFPDFNLPGRHQKLLSEIQRLGEEQEQVKIEIEDLKTEIQEVTEAGKDRKQRMLNRAEINFIELSQKKQQTESELQNFIANVLTLAKKFSQQSDAISPRLAKARLLFNEGKYEEADAVLNEKDIYEDIKKHKERAEELANELVVKAQTILINKLSGWFEQTNKFYKDAAIICENYDTCFAYAYFLHEHRQILEAVAWYEKCLTYASHEYQKSSILNNLAVLQQNKNEFDKAETSYNEALAIYRQLASINPQTYLSAVATTLNNLAILQKDKNEFDKAETSYNEALAIYRQLASINPQTYLSDIAMTLNNLAVLQKDKNEFDKAETSYNEALAIYRQLASTNPQTYLSDVAMTLNNLAILQKAKNEFDKAETSYNEALAIRRKLASINPQTYLSDVAMTLNNLAILQKAKNEFDKAETSYNEALAIYRQLASINPQTYLSAVATTLNNLAVLQSYKNEFDKAETSYNEALAIRRQLASINPQTYLSAVATTLNNLANLQQNKNEFDKAETSYNEALAIRRQLASINPQTYLSAVATTLDNLAILQKDKNEFDKAETSYNEALAIRRQLASINPQTYLSAVATTLNNLANLQSDKNEFDKAETSYNEALAIRRQLASINPQTYLFAVAMTLNNLANLQSIKNEFNKAETSYNEALAIRRQLASINPERFLIDYSTSAVCLAIFYNESIFDKEKSIFYANEAKKGFALFSDIVPFAAKWKKVAENILIEWEENKE